MPKSVEITSSMQQKLIKQLADRTKSQGPYPGKTDRQGRPVVENPKD